MDQKSPDDYISPEDREHLISELHRFLAWVGEELPEDFEANGETIKIHDIIWSCIHKKQISQKEKEDLMELVNLLEAKEKQDEETLHRSNLTSEEAKKLFHESAALIRAIMDLKECESGKVQLKDSGEDIKKKIDDAKRWLGFLKNVGKK
jgi:hypothetical protein